MLFEASFFKIYIYILIMHNNNGFHYNSFVHVYVIF